MRREIDGGSPVVCRSITANVGHGAHGSKAAGLMAVGNEVAGEEEVGLPGWNLKPIQTLHVLERRFAVEIHLAMLTHPEHPRLQRRFFVGRPEVVVAFDCPGEPWVLPYDLLEPAFERKGKRVSQRRQREEGWQRTSFLR